MENKKQVRLLELRVGILSDSGVERRDAVVTPRDLTNDAGSDPDETCFLACLWINTAGRPHTATVPSRAYLHDSTTSL